MTLKHPFLVISLLVTLCGLAQPSDTDSFFQKDRMAILLENAAIPGLSFAMIGQGEITFYHTYGLKNAESGERVDSQTIFEAASLTKPVVAYCAMKLAEEGLLDLDRPLYKYLEYRPVAHDDRYKVITARMVLSHRTGFPNWRSDRNADTLNIRFQPGSKFGYSGEGFVYLQKVMETILGADLDSIAFKYVFEPLRMTRSSLVFREYINFAVGHDKDLKPKKKFRPDTPNAAYSLHTTAGDYAKFLNELITPRFISEEARDQMFQKQSLMQKDDTSLAWGLGIGLNRTDDNTYMWHWGDNGVFKAFFIASVHTGHGFVYFANGENGLGIVKMFIEQVFSDDEIMSTWDEYEQY